MSDTSKELLQYLLLIISMPLWAPFIRALYQEFVMALRADGGLFGPVPSPMERKVIERDLAGEDLRQVHEPLAHHGQGQAETSGRNPGNRPHPGPQAGNGPRRFRSPTRTQARATGQRRNFR